MNFFLDTLPHRIIISALRVSIYRRTDSRVNSVKSIEPKKGFRCRRMSVRLVESEGTHARASSRILTFWDFSRHQRLREYLLSEDNGFLDEGFGNEWEIVCEPGIDPAFEGANSGDSFGSQQQRHPGAGRFVGSRTVENDVAIPGNLFVPLFDLFHGYAKRPRDHLRKRFDIHGLAQVYNGDGFSSREFVHEFFRRDACDPQPVKKPSALDELPQNISCQTSGYDGDQPTAPAQCDPLELIAENQAQARDGDDPEECAQGIEDQETSHGHPKDSRQRRCGGIQARDKFGNQQSIDAAPDEKILRSPHA